MYGYSIPSYARGYLRDWQRDDRFLRLRWSLDEPGRFILERKTRYLADYPFERGTDRQVQLNDGYRKVFSFDPRDIKHVRWSLETCDIQRAGGAKALAHRLETADEREWELADRAMHGEFDAIAGEMYDRLAWAEQRRIALNG